MANKPWELTKKMVCGTESCSGCNNDIGRNTCAEFGTRKDDWNAAQKKMLEFIFKPCTEHPIGDFQHDLTNEFMPSRSNGTSKYEKWLYQHRYLCPQCIQELKEWSVKV